MTELIPPGFLFRLSLPVKRAVKIPRSSGGLLQLGPEFQLPIPSELAQGDNFAELRAAWNEKGIGFALSVKGKRSPLRCDTADWENSDGLTLWIDTRSTQTIHRASRFCHQFTILPKGALRDRQKPAVRQAAIARAREEAPRCDPDDIKVQTTVRDNGYDLDVWLPAEVLHGYEPESNPCVGFYYQVVDRELGTQVLSVGAEFPYDHDPSLWWPLELK